MTSSLVGSEMCIRDSFYRGILYTFLRKNQGSFHAYFAWHGTFSVVLELLGFLAKKCYLLERLEFPGRETACIRACLWQYRIKSRCKTPLSFKLWFPAANLKNICRGRCSHRPAGTHSPPNIPPQPSHHLKSQGRAFLHSPDFNLSSLWQHRTIPALRLKHRSDGCGTASALPKCSIRHPVLSALLA